MSSIASFPYTAGELVQGIFGGVHIHVSAPIDKYATAEFSPAAGPFYGPPNSRKAVQAVLQLCSAYGFEASGRLELNSPFPRGKGLGTSTADIAASLSAVAAANGVSLSESEIAKLALSVEPTDGSIFSGIVLFDHRNGAILERLGEAPPARLLIVDTGGSVDTVVYNRRIEDKLLVTNEQTTRNALELVRSALREHDVEKLGAAARASAIAHQAILHKPGFAEIDNIGRMLGAVGIGAAHSGTVCTLFFPPDVATGDAAAIIRTRLDRPVFEASLGSGGPRFLETPVDLTPAALTAVKAASLHVPA
jgi:L-threonine kinase